MGTETQTRRTPDQTDNGRAVDLPQTEITARRTPQQSAYLLVALGLRAHRTVTLSWPYFITAFFASYSHCLAVFRTQLPTSNITSAGLALILITPLSKLEFSYEFAVLFITLMTYTELT